MKIKNILAPLLCALALTASAQTTNRPGVPTFGFPGTALPAGDNSESWTVKKTGNDTLCLPCLSISNAVKFAAAAFASNGLRQTVIVYPGEYSEHNLLAPGVDVKGMPGANILWVDPTTNEPGWGIFDDRTAGPTTNVIAWDGAVTYMGITNSVLFGSNNISPVWNLNSLGAIVLTNAGSKLRGHFGKASAGGYYNGLSPTAVFIQNNNNSIISVDEISDPLAYTTNFHNYLNKGNPAVQAQPNETSTGVYWGLGNCYVYCPKIVSGQYSIWCDEEPVGVSHTNDFYFDGEYLNGKIYTTGNNPEYKGWFNFKELEITNSGSIAAIDVNGGGKWYFSGLQKIHTAVGAGTFGLEIYPHSGGVSNAQVWIDCAKYTSPNWMNILAGTAFNTSASQFEDEGGVVTNGFNVQNNGSLFVNGGVAGATGAGMLFAGQAARIKNLTLYSTNDVPIYAAAPGLILDNVELVALNATNSISATNAQTVAIYNSIANTNWNPTTITLSPSNNVFIKTTVR